jgi:hypothetical protein
VVIRREAQQPGGVIVREYQVYPSADSEKQPYVISKVVKRLTDGEWKSTPEDASFTYSGAIVNRDSAVLQFQTSQGNLLYTVRYGPNRAVAWQMTRLE